LANSGAESVGAPCSCKPLLGSSIGTMRTATARCVGRCCTQQV
jgi:hypothetical protein